MNAVESIENAAKVAGYRAEAVVRDYSFADVLHASAVTRKVALAVFTQTPPSYRAAAFAVVEGNGADAHELVKTYRALGAPLLFVIDRNDVAVWQVRSAEPPRVVERITVAELPALFERNRDVWHPDAIHRAKSIGAVDKQHQLDFIDLGLLPAIEGEIHAKLDHLLVETLAAAAGAPGGRHLDPRLLFRVVFRLLAAKVLQDRGHPYAKKWNPVDLPSVLSGIESYYSLPTMPMTSGQTTLAPFATAWEQLRQGINFSNISADDLAFVYENTLVTPEARKLFGTHSTPRQVAEYVVRRLELHRHRPDSLKIYEPFAGAGVFLVAALRHVRDVLPIDWTDQKRHSFLVRHLAGDEIDPFACEVATLSLILADYPNQNGWNIREANLFEGNALKERMHVHNVVLCNPPFESFTAKERSRYRTASETYSKPVAVLNAALDAHPLALGFVLPRPFILEKQFTEQRRRIEKLYGAVELVELPDKTFGASDIEAALLIASDPHPSTPAVIVLRSTEIADRDRTNFLKTGATTIRREIARQVADNPSGNLWIPPLDALWEYLESYPRLDKHLQPSRGLEWTYKQSEAFRTRPEPGFRKGLHSARAWKQFVIKHLVWLDYHHEHIRRGDREEWDRPKLIANAGRLSRGPWRIGAALDTNGLLFSQQFFGLWPTGEVSERELLGLSAVLNGPVANAFIAVHSPARVIRAAAIAHIPVPPLLPGRVTSLVSEYTSLLRDRELLSDDSERLATLLTEIDAAVLAAYDLPPRLERDLLAYFSDAERPVAHSWAHWDIAEPTPGLRLAERVSRRFHPKGNWIAEVFRPLPEREAILMRELGE